jgi:hypothetical protein
VGRPNCARGVEGVVGVREWGTGGEVEEQAEPPRRRVTRP